MRRPFITTTFLLFFFLLSFVFHRPVYGNPSTAKTYNGKEALLAGDRIFEEALYYDFEKGMDFLRKKISQLESGPLDLKAHINLAIYSFYLSGLYVEYAFVLGLDKDYKLDDLKKKHLQYAEKAKTHIKKILDHKNLKSKEKAIAHMMLGATKGYIGKQIFGEGKVNDFLSTGSEIDNHLIDALRLEPNLAGAQIGLGMYRYIISRHGGWVNFMLQGGSDYRERGLSRLEKIIKVKTMLLSMAYRELIRFYIAEQLNPNNKNKPSARENSRKRAMALLPEYEARYFKSANHKNFIGNKELAQLKGTQHIINQEYSKAKIEFENARRTIDFLMEKKKYPMNSYHIGTIDMAIDFSKTMIEVKGDKNHPPGNGPKCGILLKSKAQLNTVNFVIETDIVRIGEELRRLFYRNLEALIEQHKCL